MKIKIIPYATENFRETVTGRPARMLILNFQLFEPIV